LEAAHWKQRRLCLNECLGSLILLSPAQKRLVLNISTQDFSILGQKTHADALGS